MSSVHYKKDYQERLKDSCYAQGLLRAAFEESYADGNWKAFGLILQDIIESVGAKQAFAKKAKISRQHLYRLFGKNANPTLKTISPLLSQLGLRLTLTEKAKEK